MQPKLKNTNLSLEELVPYYVPTKLTTVTQPLFNISLSYNKLKTYSDGWNVYDEVFPHIYLGRIPEKNILPPRDKSDSGHQPGLNLPDRTKLIVSLVTYGELAEVNFDYEHLEKSGIRHIYIPMADFSSEVSTKAIIKAIKLIRRYQKLNDIISRPNRKHKFYLVESIPENIKDYLNNYLITKKQLVDSSSAEIIYVRSTGELDKILVHDFGPLYFKLLAENDNYISLPESIITVITDHIPCYQTDSNVYIHCKAGRARSGMVLAIYDTYYVLKKSQFVDRKTIKSQLFESIEKLKSSRQQVDIGTNKLEKAFVVLEELLFCKGKIKISTIDFPEPDLFMYLHSLEFKNRLSQFPSFKNLCIYLAKLRSTQKRNEYLQTFLLQILNAVNEESVIEWCKMEFLKKFINARPNALKTNDADLRLKLALTFQSELKCHLLQQFGTNINLDIIGWS